jgi:membrane-associated phospholipid phosphatase
MSEPQLVLAADALGAHALPAFFAALVAVLAGTAALWWALRRFVLPRLPQLRSALPPGGLLLLLCGCGFACVLAAGALFAELSEALDAEEPLGRFDLALSRAIGASSTRAALQAFALVTHLGDVATLVGLGAAVALGLLAVGRRWLALAWLLALAGNGVLNPALKRVFERARPLHEHGLVHELGYSFPSGHSSGSVVAYGMLAYVLLRLLPAVWHLPVVLAATALAFTVGCSRVFLQVHYPSDVAAGFASGAAWLLVCVISIELTRHYRRTRRG